MSRKVIYMGHSDLKRCHVSWLGGMRGFKRIISVVWIDDLWALRQSIPFPFGKCPRGSPMLTVDYNWDEKQAAGWIFCFHLFLINCKLPFSFGWPCSADPRDTGALPAWGGAVQNCERQLICLLSGLRRYRTTSSCLEPAFQTVHCPSPPLIQTDLFAHKDLQTLLEWAGSYWAEKLWNRWEVNKQTKPLRTWEAITSLLGCDWIEANSKYILFCLFV